jgi:hypothetical protein
VSRKLGCESVDDDWDGPSVQSVVQMGSGGTFAIISDDSYTLVSDNLEFEVVGGTCGTPSRGGVSYNGTSE